MRLFLAGLAAIALLGAVVFLGIHLATRPRAPAAPLASAPVLADPAPAPLATTVTLLQAIRATSPGPQKPSPVPLGEVSPPRAAPPAGSWEAVAVAARPASLGVVGGAVGRGLNNLSDELGACFDEVVQSRFGQTPFTTVQDEEPMDDTGTPVLVLQIESGGGRARIVDAPVETRGDASDGLLACAQQVLRGRTFDVPEARRPQRHRMLFPLQP